MKRLSLYLPVEHKLDVIATGSLAAATLLPHYGLLPLGVQRLVDLGLLQDGFVNSQYLNYGCGGLAVTLAPLFIGRGLELFGTGKAEDPTIDICGMRCREDALFTGVIVYGSTGSGKTSTALLPPLDQIFSTYNREGNDPKDTRLKIGGFSLDAKMEFFEPILFFQDKAGRNVLEDTVVIRPTCIIPVGVFEEPATGHRFYLPGQAYSCGSEVMRLVSSRPDLLAAGVDPNFLSAQPSQRRITEEAIRSVVFDVEDLDLRFLGWRREGKNLVRVSAVRSRKDIEFDRSVTIPAPKQLRYVEMSGVDTGIRYNVVDNRVSSSVAGRRLANVAALVDGGEGAKKDPYWDNQAANLFAQVLDAHKLLDTRQDIGGPDILRYIEQPDRQEELISKLKARRDEMARAALAQEGRNRVLAEEARAQHQKCKDLIIYFETTWRHMAQNTKSIIESCVRNMFGPFARDHLLAQSFCSPATVSFDEMITRGRFFCFVAGNDYRDLAKLLGTALKLDAHNVILSRPARAELNKNRRILEVIDECQDYAVAGAGGDQETKSKSRGSRLIHINATQAISSIKEVVGAHRFETYNQAYGVRVYFQSLCDATRKEAASYSGQVFRERKEIQSGNLTLSHIFGGKSGGKTENTRYEKESRWSEHSVMDFDTFESLVFNKDQKIREGEQKRVRQFNKPHPIGGPTMRPLVEEFLRDYAHSAAEHHAQNLKFNPDGLGMFCHASPRTRDVGSSSATANESPAPTPPASQPPPKAPAAPSAPRASDVRNPNEPLDSARSKRTKDEEPPPLPDPSAELLARFTRRPDSTESPAPVAAAPTEDEKMGEALRRLESGKATPADRELLTAWQRKPENQLAMALRYVAEAQIGEFVHTQAATQMAERGSSTLHRGTSGIAVGKPKGHGSAPGPAPATPPSPDALDLAPEVKHAAAAVSDAATAASTISTPTGKQTIEELRKRFAKLS